ncbi:helix-turn-helix domain-containing protein [Pedobacter petrophilus]|uniref:helix-turn-helix domain-containing protein n=1 Tax=Pedobacter petrophilus TaxID=1908241 RepID=UPI0031595400
MNKYFEAGKIQEFGQPTVKFLAEKLHITPHYLSDMLKEHTGQTAQQHIHNALIEQIKALLTMTNMSISEIAYQLGFDYPQSLNKLFKKKTAVSPTSFRKSFNPN